MTNLRESGLLELWADLREAEEFRQLRTPGVRLVPGVGSYRPSAMVVGEAPGATENAQGEPFCGVSGDVLHQLMALAGLRAYWLGKQTGLRVPPGCAEGQPPNIWLTNAIKFRPPNNRTPTPVETHRAQPWLLREWRLLGRPRLIVCVGSTAAVTLGVHTPSMINRGELYPLKNQSTWVCYQFHPAYGLRGGQDRKDMMEKQWELMGMRIKEMRKELRWVS